VKEKAFLKHRGGAKGGGVISIKEETEDRVHVRVFYIPTGDFRSASLGEKFTGKRLKRNGQSARVFLERKGQSKTHDASNWTQRPR